MKEELLPLLADRCDRSKSVSLVAPTGTLRLMDVAVSSQRRFSFGSFSRSWWVVVLLEPGGLADDTRV
ncbi:MAG: hypothetical protein KME45_08470 [Stenomitos rutilans HA7619-LM2]|nr:hypothetical protein [Stenomitos rutilans HA7619-LM2]